MVEQTPLPATATQIANHLGIAVSTLYLWMNEHPAFMEAVKRRRAQADDEVEGSLYGRAKGYTATITEDRLDKEGITHTLAKEIHVAADPNAGLNWLKNRRPEEWRDKKEVEITGSHTDILRKLMSGEEL